MTLEQASLLYGRYRIETILGRGGMGAVYKAVDENLGIHVAVKENLFTTEEYARQFRREATLLAALRHPNLPRVTDHFVIPGQGQYLVMDYIEGEDLRTRIDRGNLPTERMVVDWGRQVCEALVYLHTRQPTVIHRDIKPGNIRITPDGRALLVDFGLARIMEGSQTTTGAKAMTPGYSPPEQYGASRTDIRTDIYSLAATLYTLVTGSIPEDGLERALGQHTLTPIRSRNPKISAPVAEAIEKALAVLPENRFQNAEEFRKALLSNVSSSAPVIIPEPKLESPTIPATQEKIIASSTSHPVKKPAARSGVRLWLLPFLGVLTGLMVISLIVIAMIRGVALPTFSIPVIPTAANHPAESQTAAKTTELAVLAVTPTPMPTPTPTKEVATATVEPTSTPLPLIGNALSITFARAKNANTPAQIFSMNADGTDVVQITDFPDGACQPDWSADGLHLLFVSPCTKLGGAMDANPNIYEWSPAKIALEKPIKPEEATILTREAGGDYNPAWSPDGTKIAFTHIQGGNSGIYIMDKDGNNKSRKRISKSGATEEQPRWSPDGKNLVYTSITNNNTVFVGSLDGSMVIQIQVQNLDRNTQTYAPDWSSDGKILFLLKSNGRMYITSFDNLSVVNLRSGQFDTPNSQQARFSPDGLYVVFDKREPNGNYNLYRYPTFGGGQEGLAILRTFEIYGDATWRPIPKAMG
jgi:eukaryotic-like serine/threonine-protein kinase